MNTKETLEEVDLTSDLGQPSSASEGDKSSSALGLRTMNSRARIGGFKDPIIYIKSL